MNLAAAATCAFAMIVDEMTNTHNKTVVSLLAPVFVVYVVRLVNCTMCCEQLGDGSSYL
jgi:hypothetical protein